MASAHRADTDIVTAVGADHRTVEAIFDRFSQTPTDEWGDLSCELVTTLVQHEVAEEEVVFPSVRRLAGADRRVVDARIAEQAEAEELLADMEAMTPGSSEFVRALSTLKTAVLAHAEREESEILPLLSAGEDAEERRRLGELYEKAKAAGPTHPHPHAPDTPPGNLLVGPAAALIDRVRDAVRSVTSESAEARR